MFYWFTIFILKVLTHIVYRFRVSGTENIPHEGAFILCGNHIHSYDPAMIAIPHKRQLRFMAKKELFKGGAKTWFFRQMGAFPVDRGKADISSYRAAMSALKSGMGLVIFSQGTRMQELDINSAKGGVALFGVKAQVPIIPVGINGTYKFRSVLSIRYGSPISLEEYYGSKLKADQIDEIVTNVMKEIEKLVD